ncbi:MAG: sulfotransferase [Hyphomonadaceae bacterium]|nr:sulfotransferase [Hyphomonadaceae bacterium]
MQDDHVLLCIGQARSGTTWLSENLRRTGQFFMPPIKELNYFSTLLYSGEKSALERVIFGADRPEPERGDFVNLDAPRWRHFAALIGAAVDGGMRTRDLRAIDWMWTYLREPTSFDAYRALLRLGRPRVTVDCSPEYFILPRHMIEAIREALPRAKVVALLRDPMDRLLSHLTLSAAEASMAEAMTIEDWRNFFAAPHSSPALRHVWAHCYADYHVAEWTRAFGPDFHAFAFEDLVERPADLIKAVCDFAGVDRPDLPVYDQAHAKVNEAAGAKITLSPECASAVRVALAAINTGKAKRLPPHHPELHGLSDC